MFADELIIKARNVCSAVNEGVYVDDFHSV